MDDLLTERLPHCRSCRRPSSDWCDFWDIADLVLLVCFCERCWRDEAGRVARYRELQACYGQGGPVPSPERRHERSGPVPYTKKSKECTGMRGRAMDKRNRTNTNTDAPTAELHDWQMTPQQLMAVDALVTGRNIQQTADLIGVGRPTVSGWLHHHAGFQAAMNLRRQELWQDLIDGLRSLAPEAIEVLKRELQGETPLQAAVHILRACSIYGTFPAPSGPTDPHAIAVAQQPAEDERQHASE